MTDEPSPLAELRALLGVEITSVRQQPQPAPGAKDCTGRFLSQGWSIGTTGRVWHLRASAFRSRSALLSWRGMAADRKDDLPEIRSCDLRRIRRLLHLMNEEGK